VTRSPQDRATDHIMADAIEHALWQDLADALQRLEDWGLMPLGELADRLGVNAIQEIDAGRSNGGAIRTGGYLLRYQAPFTPDPDQRGQDLPSGWQVVTREA